MIRRLNTIALICIVNFTNVFSQQSGIKLKELGVEYVPYKYTPSKEFAYNVGAAEQGALDPNNHYFYAVGLNLIHVIDFSDPSKTSLIHHVEMDSQGEITDIQTCGDIFAIAFDPNNSPAPLDGRVMIFNLYNPNSTESMKMINDLVVGTVPDMLHFTHDCERILVALEGELTLLPDGTVVDPEGGVTIIRNPKSPSASVKTLDFTQFNSEAEKYVQQGVRWIYKGEGTNLNTTFSQDLEPQHITINEKDSVAYINLQANNAILTVDLNTETITSLQPLYKKSWSTDCSLDASNKDLGINLKHWDIFGLSQPDGIKYFKHSNGVEYIITANEGSTKEYEKPDFPFEWTESRRGKEIFESGDVSSSVREELKQSLKEDSQLGRLRMSSVDGLDSNGEYVEFVTYGTRSFSVYKIDGGQLNQVYDSCDDFEKHISQKYPDIFNSNPKDDDETPYESSDSRSDDQGPSPEALAFGSYNGKQLIFIGIEKPGLIAVYEMEGEQPVFQSMNYFGDYSLSRNKTFQQMYEDRETHSNDPGDLTYIDALRSPTGSPLLVVCGSVSGTVAFLELTRSTGTRLNTQFLLLALICLSLGRIWK